MGSATSTSWVTQPAALPAHNFTTNLGVSLANCPAVPQSSLNPATVNGLRISDFRHIISMGDSISAGYDARYTFANVPYPNNDVVNVGTSFVTGNDADAFSIGKFARKARGSDFPLLSTQDYTRYGCTKGFFGGDTCTVNYQGATTNLNVALPGMRIAVNTLNREITAVSNRYSWLPGSDEWKLIVIQGGFNDICRYCDDFGSDPSSLVTAYSNNLRNNLNTISTNYKKTVVVLTSPFNPAMIVDKGNGNARCRGIYGVNKPCRCYNGPGTQSAIDLQSMVSQLRSVSQTLAASYNTSSTFRVVYDSGFSYTNVDNDDIVNITSSRDCFHPSGLAQAHFAYGAWTNLFLPSSQKKPYNVDPAKMYTCPTEANVIRFD